MNYLLDTNILGELARPRVDPNVAQWATQVSRAAVSAVTTEEIAYGLSWRPNLRVQQVLDRIMRESCEVLPVTEEIARAAGRLRGQLQASGQSRTQADMLIAATAAAHGLTVVSRNTADFDGCGVAVLNPFRR